MLLPSSHTSSLHSMPSNLSWWYSWGKETIWYLIVIMPLLRTAGLVAPAIGLHVPISGDRRISGVKLSPVSVRNWSHHRFDFRVRGETDGMMNETDPKGVRQHQANSVRVLCCCLLYYVQNANHPPPVMFGFPSPTV